MNDDVRSLLHALADRVADGMSTEGLASGTTSTAGRPADRDAADALLTALSAVAKGDLSLRHASLLGDRPEGLRLREFLERVRELHGAALGVIGAGTDRLDDVRASAERASDTASRQRIVLDRVAEQVKQLAERAGELAASAAEMGGTSERAALLALNTGIEGLRVGGEVARTLGSLGEELRKLSQRSAGGARDLAAGLEGVVDRARGAVAALDEARVAAKLAGEEAARAASAAESARRADRALASAVSRFHAMDTQTEALVAQIDATVVQLASDVDRAREKLQGLEPSARVVVESALERVEHLATARRGGTIP